MKIGVQCASSFYEFHFLQSPLATITQHICDQCAIQCESLIRSSLKQSAQPFLIADNGGQSCRTER